MAKARKQAEVLHRAGVTVADAQQAIQRAAKANARAQHSTYPCDVCGRESKYYLKWKPDDLRRRSLPRERRHETTLPDTWCWWHAPAVCWPRWRRWVYIAFTFVSAPRTFLRVWRLQREAKS